MGAARVDSILDQVRASGGRVTDSRRALVEVLDQAGGHLTAEDLVSRLRATQPQLAESTVYRLLSDLEARHLVRHVHLVHGPAVYHLEDDDHHHLRCNRCGAVIDIPSSILDPVIDTLRDEHGFHLDPGHTALQGTCEACARKEGRRARPGR